jgi:hypothetical protein
MMVAVQGGKKDREFKGSFQLRVNLQEGGKSVMMVLPSDKEEETQHFLLNFRRFQRVVGAFPVPAGAKVTSVEVRLLQDGATKVSEVVNL